MILAGLIIGAISGGLTYAFTVNALLALIVGVAVTILAWLGHAAVIILDD